MLFITNLIVEFTDGVVGSYDDVHPDQSFTPRDGVLTFETTSGDAIYYLPIDNIRHWYTECVQVRG
jgi:predicted small integral membrane protein